jgi:hypothetical protein
MTGVQKPPGHRVGIRVVGDRRCQRERGLEKKGPGMTRVAVRLPVSLKVAVISYTKLSLFHAVSFR